MVEPNPAEMSAVVNRLRRARPDRRQESVDIKTLEKLFLSLA